MSNSKAGRPKGSTGNPTSRLRFRIEESIAQRLEMAYPDHNMRSEFVEQAITLMLDIKDGKRNFPTSNLQPPT